MALRTDDDRVSTDTPGSGEPKDYRPGYLNKQEQNLFEGIDKNYGSSTADDTDEQANIDRAAKALESKESTPSDNWQTNVGPKAGGTNEHNYKNKRGKAKSKGMRAFKIGGPFGLVIAVVLGGGSMMTVFGPATMLVNLSQNIMSHNNSAETTFSNRALKVLGNKMAGQGELCDARRVKCKMGVMSTKGLKRLADKGVVAYDADGNDLSKSTNRYPKALVASYKVDGVDYSVNQIREAISKDHKLAGKIFGTAGAFNLRYQVWTGKHMKTNLFNRFGIKRNGGTADGSNNRNTTVANTLGKLKGMIPSIDGLSDKASQKISAKTSKMISKGKKGGLGYLGAVGACVGTKLPSMIAYGVAAVQVARILPLVSDTVLSPGSKLQGSLVTNISGEDVSAAADLLTATDENGKSALDSKFLHSAAGISRGTTGLSEDFTPGYSILKNETIQGLRDGEEHLEPACNAVLSPAAMWTAVGVNSTITVLASATIVGGIIKIGAEWVAGKAIEKLVSKAAEAGAKAAINELAENDALDKVLDGEPGEKLGDAIGISAMAFTSAGEASRHIPVLKESSLPDFQVAKANQMEFQRQIDIASMSPFDISSQHTWLGSIVHGANTYALANGGYQGIAYLKSMASYVASAPARLLTNTTSANYLPDQSYCQYADQLDMQGEIDSPAINAAGLPCHGFISGIETSTAIDIVSGGNAEGENWLIDEAINEVGVDYEAGLEDIVREDSRLSEYLQDCGAASIENGDWNDTAFGCTLDLNTSTHKEGFEECTEEITENCYEFEEDVEEDEFLNIKNSSEAEAQAIAAFAIDYQISQSIDGNDPEELADDTPAPTPELPDGDNQALAKKIIASGKVSGGDIVMDQIRSYAETGEPDIAYDGRECHVNPTIMQTIYELSTKYDLILTSINRYCINLLTASGEDSFHWRDGGGHALDIGMVDGVLSTGATSEEIDLLKYIAPKLPAESAVGQIQCRAKRGVSIELPIRQFEDSCNHTHINVPIRMAS